LIRRKQVIPVQNRLIAFLPSAGTTHKGTIAHKTASKGGAHLGLNARTVDIMAMYA
jgi:hypothetical protein